MKKLSAISFAIAILLSCNKKNVDTSHALNSNELNATIKFSTGGAVALNEKGVTVQMGCISNDGFYIEAVDMYSQNLSMKLSTCYPQVGKYNVVKSVFQPSANGRLQDAFVNHLENFTVTIDKMDADAQICEGAFSGLLVREYESPDTYEIVKDSAVVSGKFRGNTFLSKVN